MNLGRDFMMLKEKEKKSMGPEIPALEDQRPEQHVFDKDGPRNDL